MRVWYGEGRKGHHHLAAGVAEAHVEQLQHRRRQRLRVWEGESKASVPAGATMREQQIGPRQSSALI